MHLHTSLVVSHPRAEPSAQKQAYLCVCDGADAFALVGEEEVDGFEEFMDGAAELLLALTPGGSGIEPPRLDDVLEDILRCLVGGGVMKGAVMNCRHMGNMGNVHDTTQNKQ